MKFITAECQEIYQTISFYNKGDRGQNKIPESDVLTKDLANTLTINADRVHEYLKSLRDSHFIFIFNIAKEDQDRNFKALDGYVIASKEIIQALLPEYDAELHILYKSEKHRDKSTDGIFKELLPEIHHLNNSQIGKAINTISMLKEYERYLENHPEEFTDEYRENLLESQLKSRKLIEDKKIVLKDQEDVSLKALESSFAEMDSIKDDSDDSKDETDSLFLGEYRQDKLTLSFEKALKIYGLRFIIRFYINKNKYVFIEELVRQKRFFDLKDLRFIREILKSKMKNIYSKSNTSFHKSDIFRLDRTLNQVIRKYNV